MIPDKYDRHHGTNFHEMWLTLQSQVLYVNDEMGVNMNDAQVRHIEGKNWLYVDEIDGFKVLTDDLLEELNLTDYQPNLGYAPNGEVIYI